VKVLRRPRVRIIPTGEEMVDVDAVGQSPPEAGRIIESNSTVLGKLVEANGGEFLRHHGIRDDAEEIARVIRQAAETDDAVLVIGGSSAGARGFTRTAIERAVEELVAPALHRMQGVRGCGRVSVAATPTRKITSKLGMEELVRVRLGRVGDNLVANPLSRGAGTITSITRADGIVRVGADLEGLHPDQEVVVELLRPLADIERNIVAVGSHDLCLDVIADLLHRQQTGLSLSSSHLGSLAGIMAVKGGRCHLAGSHLLDPEDGSYNTSYIAKHLAGVALRLVHLVERQQGLMLRKGNPRAIGGFEDLLRDEVTFINRQGGSGTRVLLDYELGRRGLFASDISGYETEEYTHMAVAVAVASGVADVGLGVLSAARALQLDFVPVTSERYDLIIPEVFFEGPSIQRLLEVIRSAEFARRVDELGGYDSARSGQVVR
jgi:putative molybdopterin biosynthesis protein